MMKRFYPFALALSGGIISAFSMSPTNAWPLIFIGLSLFYVAYSTCYRTAGSFFSGFIFGLGYFTTGLWWVGNALLVDGNEYAWVWPVAVIGLPTILSIFTGLGTLAARKIVPDNNYFGYAAFCFCLTLSEYVRGHIFTGFPWNLYGYTWTGQLPMLQVLHVIGSYGLTLLTVFWAVLPGFLIVSSSSRRLKITETVCALSSMAAIYGYGYYRLQAHPVSLRDDVQVKIVQPNISQDMKWRPELMGAHFETELRLSAYNAENDSHLPTVIVWPETAIPSSLLNHPVARQRLADMLAGFPASTHLISGILDKRNAETDDPLYYNGVGVFDASGSLEAVYSKTHLVPFGEFIPFQKYIPLEPVVEFSGFQKGTGPATISYQGIPLFSPLVCYEIIFPGDVTPRSGERSDWIVTVTNDAWYGDSAGPRQHFAHAIYRAIEEGLPVARSANTGISGLTDPYGRVLAKLDLFQEGSISHLMPARLNSTLYHKTGDWPLLGFILIALGGAFMLHRNRK